MTPKMILRIFAVVVVGVLIGVLATNMLEGNMRDLSGKTGSVVATDFMPQFTLTDQNGQKVSAKDLSAKYQLVYFGFTSCPEICPTEMMKITNALSELPQDLKDKLQPVFITVDPERDTEEALRSFLEPFDSSFIALRGTEDEIDAVADDFKVYAQKAEDPQLSDYTINHSSYIYFIAPNGDLLALFRTEDSAETMAQSIENAMTGSAAPSEGVSLDGASETE